jgi:vitamin B12 transporter
LHASGASSYTPPSLQDLYFPGAGNPNLKPETSLGWEAGVEQPLLGGRITPGATYFHNDITNYIQYSGALPENVASATTDGVEVDVQAKPVDQLTLDVNYTYLNAINNDSATQPRLLRRPRNSLNFTATWKPIDPLTLSLGGSWVVDRQDYNPAIPPYGADTPAPDYFVLRASATYRINKYVTVWVRGENLTDDHYQPVLGYPALGLGGYGGIKVSF